MPNGNLGPDYQLGQRLANIERQLAALATSPWLLNASTGQIPGQPGLSTDINGLHLFNPAGVEDITLSTSDGSANFNGNVNINGNLSVPSGSITNAALQNPVSPNAYHGDAASFGITTGSNVPKCTVNVPVPAGYSQALVFAATNMSIRNNSGNTDDAYLGLTINGAAPGWSAQVTAANGIVAALARAGSALVTGLSGGTLPVVGTASSGSYAWTSTSASAMNVDVSVLFLR